MDIFPSSFDKDLAYYIAGPMSGIKEYNYPAFQKALEDFTSFGVHVLSPHAPFANDKEEVHESRTYEWYIRTSLRMLLRADGIVLLPGWTQSKGARREADIAMDLKYPVWFYDFNDITSMDRQP
jgi:hypothetical protein